MNVLLYNLLTFYTRYVGGSTSSMLYFAHFSAIIIVIFSVSVFTSSVCLSDYTITLSLIETKTRCLPIAERPRCRLR